MIWTAISFNWSTSLTSANIFLSNHDRHTALKKFADTFPGEVILALIAGDHVTKTSTFPLTAPGFNNRQPLESDK
tara:strand:+ start:406 stop:630 length:225 start_codon:yes stop_codon:yes gene_type:complete